MTCFIKSFFNFNIFVRLTLRGKMKLILDDHPLSKKEIGKKQIGVGMTLF